MKLMKNLLILPLTFVMFITMACEDEKSETPPESATISGTITFSGDWPSTGTVHLSIPNTWYPVDAPYATTSISESDVTANVYVYSFTEVAFGTYPAISVSWEDPEDTNPATNQHIIGVYGGTAAAYFADADSITVSEDIYELTSLDFGADFGLAHPAPENATISGTITFSGDWPSAGTVYLTVDNTWYPVDAPYATRSISESDVTANAYAYSFTEVAFGTYAAISVSWLDLDDTNPATNWHIIGVYGGTAAAYFADADSITVSEDIYELTGLDFGADFGLVQP